MYHFCVGCTAAKFLDRLLIDLELNISSSFTERRTYSGIRNFVQFDMSFKIEKVCNEHYFGTLCDIFCSEEGVLTCDEQGNRVCVNSLFDPETNCTECLQMDGNCLPGSYILYENSI